MGHYYKLAFTAFRILGSLVTIYSLLSLGYVLITVRPTVPSTIIATFLPAFTYLLFGILVFVFSKQLARVAVKGIDREYLHDKNSN
jgi:VanZ family protein